MFTKTPQLPPEDPKTAALNFVNKLREAMGAEPLDALPPGKLRAYAGCPIYNALKDVSHGKLESVNLSRDSEEGKKSENAVRIDDNNILYPEPVRTFVTAFDKGEYPELISSIAEIRAKNITKKLEDIPVQAHA